MNMMHSGNDDAERVADTLFTILRQTKRHDGTQVLAVLNILECCVHKGSRTFVDYVNESFL
jgi:hypothetical protein